MTHPFAVDADTLSGMRPLSTAVFALGSNLGDRLENLQGALEGLRNTPDVMIVDVSGVYETDAVGGPEDNPEFLNAVVVTETTLQPRTLLDRALAIEEAYGRVREEVDGPRTLDVDLLIVGKREIDEQALRLPHPRAHERAFVLVPWHEVDPRAAIPGRGTVAELLAGLDTSGVRRRDDLVLED